MTSKKLATVAWMAATATILLNVTSCAVADGFDQSFDQGNLTAAESAQLLLSEGWRYIGDARISNGHLVMQNEGKPNGFGLDIDQIGTPVVEFSNFTQTLLLNRLQLGDYDRSTVTQQGGPQSSVQLSINISDRDGLSVDGAALNLREIIGPLDEDDNSQWQFECGPSTRSQKVNVDKLPVDRPVEIGMSVVNSAVTCWLDDPADKSPAFVMSSFNSLDYRFNVPATIASFVVTAATIGVTNDVEMDQWTLTPISAIYGDFDGDLALDDGDIDELFTKFASVRYFAAYDLSKDGLVNLGDVEAWIHYVMKSYFGDANLDGQFNTTDLVNIFVAGQYEDSRSDNSTWSSGDWDGDGDFTSIDLMLAFQDGGYEQSPPAVAAPEPSGLMALGVGAMTFALGRRRV